MTHWTTKLIQTDARPPEGFQSLVTPVFRGSTTVFPNAAAANDNWRQEAGYTYGLYGTPTTRTLAARIAELEHGERTFLTTGGQAAIALIYFSFVRAGGFDGDFPRFLVSAACAIHMILRSGCRDVRRPSKG